MPRTSLSEETDSERSLREEARIAYCAQFPIANIAKISKDKGVPRTTSQNWRDQDGWEEQRQEQMTRRAKKLLEKVGDPEESAVEILDACKQLLAEANKVRVAQGADRAMQPEALQIIVNVVGKINDIRKDAYKQLGLGLR